MSSGTKPKGSSIQLQFQSTVEHPQNVQVMTGVARFVLQCLHCDFLLVFQCLGYCGGKNLERHFSLLYIYIYIDISIVCICIAVSDTQQIAHHPHRRF